MGDGRGVNALKLKSYFKQNFLRILQAILLIISAELGGNLKLGLITLCTFGITVKNSEIDLPVGGVQFGMRDKMPLSKAH